MAEYRHATTRTWQDSTSALGRQDSKTAALYGGSGPQQGGLLSLTLDCIHAVTLDVAE